MQESLPNSLQLTSLVKENPITYNNTMLDRIRFEMSIIQLTNKNLIDIEKKIESCIDTRNKG